MVKLSKSIGWELLENTFSKYYSHTGRKGKNIRLLLGLQILSYMKDLSDEGVCASWLENPYYQYFCGGKLFQHRLPMDRSSISRFRKRAESEDLEKILQESLRVAHDAGALSPKDMRLVAVDTTVQNKAVDSPSEIKLLLDAILDLGRSAKKAGLKLKQNYRFVAKSLARKASGYAHAKQFKRLKKTTKQLKTILYKLNARIENATEKLDMDKEEIPTYLQEKIKRSKKVLSQDSSQKDRLLVWPAEEVECIARGKVKKPYEFGCKVSLSVNLKQTKGGHFILSSNAIHGKPYDGHTLNFTLEKVKEITGTIPKRIYVDRGYAGHDYPEKLCVFKSGQKRGSSRKNQVRA